MDRPVFSLLPKSCLARLRSALEAADLPVSDLSSPGRRFYQLADAEGVIGFVGLEGEGAERLLRSLVVLPDWQRRGHGERIVMEAEALARSDGVGRLHLLTISAADFFRRRGYLDCDRRSAPPEIRQTAQFASLCPGRASYLVKRLI